MVLFRKRRRKKETIKRYLLDNKFKIHEENHEKEVYVKNLNVVQLDFKQNTVSYFIGDKRMFIVGFLPTVTLFLFLIKNADTYYENTIK